MITNINSDKINNIGNNTINTIYIDTGDKTISVEYIDNLYDKLKDEGSLFIKHNNNYKDNFESIFNSKLKMFQVFCVINKKPNFNVNQKLDSTGNEIYWLSKVKPKKFKKSLEKKYRTEVWDFSEKDQKDFEFSLKENIKLLTCEKDDIMIEINI